MLNNGCKNCDELAYWWSSRGDAGGIHGATLAQEQPALVVSEYQVLEQRDAFGVNQLVLSGVVHNTSTEEAFQNVSLFAEGYTAEGELVAEAFGILVNQCNENTPPDFVLKPEHAQRFLRLWMFTKPMLSLKPLRSS
ncbi:MAG UNVERIFIED_CONTAM: hypothetical protein LVT10_10170 [Anaerolineae bacterium]